MQGVLKDEDGIGGGSGRREGGGGQGKGIGGGRWGELPLLFFFRREWRGLRDGGEVHSCMRSFMWCLNAYRGVTCVVGRDVLWRA